MRLKTKSIVASEFLTPDTEYEVREIYRGLYAVDDRSVNLSDFLGVYDMFKALIPTAGKVLLQVPTVGQPVDLLMTDDHIIVYSHRKGNHWNIFGSHYYYFHDINTGTFVPESSLTGAQYAAKDRPILKEKLRKSNAMILVKIYLEHSSFNRKKD